jgi:hypothetical protein
LIDDNATVELDDVAASLSDWRSQYPSDPWLPRFYARLLHDYHRAGASSSDRAVAMLNEMKSAYPDAPETSEILAMTFAGGTLVPVPVPVAAAPVYVAPAPVTFASVAPAAQLRPGAWQRFDSMRSGTPTTPSTSTTVTTTVTTSTGSGGP